jgi:hypothetical protein
MPAPTIAARPSAPSRNQTPDAFSTTADTFVAALSPFRVQINALVAYLNSTAIVLGQFQDGTAAAPSIRFESDTDTGFYRIGPNQMGLAQGGAGLGQLFARGNILGTVSQSGGIPTGAVIERDSNTNGHYVRWADGTQICTHNITVGTTTSASGSIFLTNETAWTYPVPFASLDFACGARVASAANPFWVTQGTTGTGMETAYFRVASSITNTAGLLIRVFALGRWY